MCYGSPDEVMILLTGSRSRITRIAIRASVHTPNRVMCKYPFTQANIILENYANWKFRKTHPSTIDNFHFNRPKHLNDIAV